MHDSCLAVCPPPQEVRKLQSAAAETERKLAEKVWEGCRLTCLPCPTLALTLVRRLLQDLVLSEKDKDIREKEAALRKVCVGVCAWCSVAVDPEPDRCSCVSARGRSS